MTDVILFSEDTLIEQAARKIIAVENPALNISTVMGGKGFSYFRNRLAQIRRSARTLTFLVFLDGDELRAACLATSSKNGFTPGNLKTSMSVLHFMRWRVGCLLIDKTFLRFYKSPMI